MSAPTIPVSMVVSASQSQEHTPVFVLEVLMALIATLVNYI